MSKSVSRKDIKFLTEFIELYKSLPCLWKVKCKEYNDRQAKAQAYNILVAKMKEIDEDADRNTVVKKINTLRTCYRKEVRKVLNSTLKYSGLEAYTPRLWYFDLLKFLNEEELTSDIVHNLKFKEELELENSEELAQIEYVATGDLSDNLENSSSPQHLLSFYEEKMSRPSSPDSLPLTPCSSTSHISINACKESFKRKHNEEISYGRNARISKNFKAPPDTFALIGNTWGAKLRDLSIDQRNHAEKLINDVFYEASLGNLNRRCTLNIISNIEPH